MGRHSDSAIDVRTESSPDEQDCSSDTSVQFRTFVRCLRRYRRIFVLCAAGLSTARGIPNFIDPGTLWRNQRAVDLSNIDAFNSDPGMVWKYFAKLRSLALKARPTQAHVNLAELAWWKQGLMCLTEDIDGLFRKAHFPRDQLLELYGSLMDFKCSDSAETGCTHIDKDNIDEPVCLCPALAISGTELESFSYEQPTVQSKKNKSGSRKSNTSEATEQAHNENTRNCDMQTIPLHELPHCPDCILSLLRPGLNWPGEPSLRALIDKAKRWMDCQISLDMMIVIGTPANKQPAAEFVQKAMDRGARIAWVGVKRNEMIFCPVRENKDWLFPGDVGEVLEELFAEELRTDIV